MVTRKDITRAAWDWAHEVARQMDLSGMDAQALHDAAMWAFGHLDIIKREILDWAWQVVNQPPISQDPVLVQRCIDIARKGVPIWVYFRAVTIAATREIEVRSKKNKTNHYFGLLKLAHHFKDVELQQKAWRPLKRILLAIPYKWGWFHPERKDGWRGVVHLSVAQLLDEHASLDASSTLIGMAENRFGASVYRRVTSRFIDEVRSLISRAMEIAVRDVRLSRSAADEGLQRLAVIKLVAETANGFDKKDARRAILNKVEALIENPDQIPDHPRGVRADFVRNVAQDRGVSEQQARRDLREFVEQIKADEALQRVRDEIRELGQLRIVLREVQLEPEVNQEN